MSQKRMKKIEGLKAKDLHLHDAIIFEGAVYHIFMDNHEYPWSENPAFVVSRVIRKKELDEKGFSLLKPEDEDEYLLGLMDE